MYSALINRLGRSMGVRISAWYAVGFVVSIVVVGLFARWVIVEGDRTEDREELLEDFAEKSAWLRQVGFEVFREEIQRKNLDADTTLMRLSEADGRTDLLIAPEGEGKSEAGWVEGRMRAGRTSGWQRVPKQDGKGIWQIYAREMPDGRWLQLAMSDHHSQEGEERLSRALLPVGAVVVLLALVGGTGLTGRALRPLRRLIDTTRGVIDSGDMTARVPVRAAGGNELDELNALFNRMLAKNESLIRGMREALDNVAHDLRTPLTRLRSSAEAALRDQNSSAEARGEALSDAIEESDQVLAILRALTDISEAEHGVMRLNREPVEILPLLAHAVDLYEYSAEARGVRIEVDAPADLRVLSDRVRLQQVVANLLDNAVKYSARGGEVRISAGCNTRKAGEVWLTVRDTGTGIPAHDLPRIWDRLYRGDQSRTERGSGLGLSLVKAVVQAHGGRVEVESKPGKGSVFSVFLPGSCVGCS